MSVRKHGPGLALALSLLALGPRSFAQAPPARLPQLNAITRVSLGPSYNCRAASDIEKGYEATALFLSDFSRFHNSPDLRYDGVCGGPDTFESHTPDTDDMSLVADLGAGVPVESVSAWRAFNPRSLDTPDSYSRFARQVPVVLGHTYAILLDDRERRGLVVFSVEGHIPNQRVDLRLAVKHYQVLKGVDAESPGFQWDTGSVEALTDVSLRRSGDILIVAKEVVVSASVDRVWAAFTEPREMRSWMGPSADADLRAGGRYEAAGLPNERILSFVPYEMLSHSGGFPSSSSGWVVWRFEPAGASRTRVSFRGFVPGGVSSESARSAEGLARFLARLLARFSGKPQASAPASPEPLGTLPPRGAVSEREPEPERVRLGRDASPAPTKTPRLGRVKKGS